MTVIGCAFAGLLPEQDREMFAFGMHSKTNPGDDSPAVTTLHGYMTGFARDIGISHIKPFCEMSFLDCYAEPC